MSSNKNPIGRWPRMAALAVMAGIILLASGCGGSSSSNPDASSSAGTSNAAKAVAFANCMRAHGVNVSVGGNGSISGGGGSGGGSAQQAQTAQNDCRHLLPNGGKPNQAAQEQTVKQALKYSQCMRSHGVPNFPDPTVVNNGISIQYNTKSRTPAFTKASQDCQSLMAGLGAGAGGGS